MRHIAVACALIAFVAVPGTAGAVDFNVVPGNPYRFPDCDLVGCGLPAEVELADFDEDGLKDVVAPMGGTAEKSYVLFGAVPGPFATTPTPLSDSSGNDVAVADLNGDGHQDIAMADVDTSLMPIQFGDGLGGFTPGTPVTAGANPRSIVAVDLNGDGDVDLANTNQGTSSVSVHLNQGDGTFAAQTEFPVGSDPNSIVDFDFNSNGVRDLAITNYGDDTVTILANDGFGELETVPGPLSTGNQPRDLTTADLDRNGLVDLVVANDYLGNPPLSILMAETSISFQAMAPFNYFTATDRQSVEAADLNGDGHRDLVAVGRDTGPVVFLGEGDGKFHLAFPAIIGGTEADGVALHDVNGDSRPDVVLPSRHGFTIGFDTFADVTVFLNSGGPEVESSPSSLSFGSSQPVGTMSPPQTVTITHTPGSDDLDAPDFLRVAGYRKSGANPGDFARSDDTCLGIELGVGESCSFQVRFTPSATGTRTASLQVNSNGDPQTIALSGSGSDAPIGPQGPAGPIGPQGPKGDDGEPAIKLLALLASDKLLARAGKALRVRFATSDAGSAQAELFKGEERIAKTKQLALGSAGMHKLAVSYFKSLGKSKRAKSSYRLVLTVTGSDGQVASDSAKVKVAKR